MNDIDKKLDKIEDRTYSHRTYRIQLTMRKSTHRPIPIPIREKVTGCPVTVELERLSTLSTLPNTINETCVEGKAPVTLEHTYKGLSAKYDFNYIVYV